MVSYHRYLAATLLAASLASAAHGAEPAQPDSTFSAGIGIAVVPKYLGADEWRAMPMIDLSYANKYGLFASTRKGVGLRTGAGPLQVSAALGVAAGRRERDARRRFGSEALRGMGDIRSSTVASLGVGYDFGFMTLGMQAELALNHRERGNRLEFALGVPLLADAMNKLDLFASLDVGDRKNMQTFYGVTAAQSARTGYRVHTPKAGVEKGGFGISWNRQLGTSWSVRSTAGAYRLVGDAAASPLTKRKTAPVLFTTLNYRF